MKSIPFMKFDIMTLLTIYRDTIVLVWIAKLGVKKGIGLLIFFKNLLGILCTLPHPFLIITLGCRCDYYSHFKDSETESLTGEETRLRSQN